MKPQIIITGHDLGYSPSVNDGFSYILSSPNKFFSELSILPNARASIQAVKIAKESNVPVNLAISLVNAKQFCLSRASSLLGEGNHLKDVQNIKSWDFSVIDTFDPSDIELEITAQYQWFLDNFGHKPSALVTQKGEHGDPKILEPMIKLAKQEGLPMRAPWWKWQTNYGAQSLVEFEGIKTTSQIIVCFKDWQNISGFDLEEDFDKIIAKIYQSAGVTELAVLPGFCDRDLLDTTSLSWQRGRAVALFEQKYDLIERLYNDFDVITYSDL
jgi:predicted glycoside hydrolase/deacetylase ChbG (UPF0249 family)